MTTSRCRCDACAPKRECLPVAATCRPAGPRRTLRVADDRCAERRSCAVALDVRLRWRCRARRKVILTPAERNVCAVARPRRRPTGPVAASCAGSGRSARQTLDQATFLVGHHGTSRRDACACARDGEAPAVILRERRARLARWPQPGRGQRCTALPRTPVHWRAGVPAAARGRGAREAHTLRSPAQYRPCARARHRPAQIEHRARRPHFAARRQRHPLRQRRRGLRAGPCRRDRQAFPASARTRQRPNEESSSEVRGSCAASTSGRSRACGRRCNGLERI